MIDDTTPTTPIKVSRIGPLEASSGQAAEMLADWTEIDRAKDAFLGVLSHELRTPINVIMGYASLMADGAVGPLTDDQRHFLEQILAGSESLLVLVNDMLDMGRIRAGRLTIAPAPVVFAEVASAVLEDVGPTAQAKDLRLQLEMPIELPPLLADEERVHQILRILLSNAIKFTPEGGAIEVRARVLDRRLRVEVQDTGIGVAKEDLPRMFRRFEQLDDSRTRRHGGAGLGLAIACSLIEAQGGEIGAESAPGIGSTFWFELPLAVDQSPLMQ